MAHNFLKGTRQFRLYEYLKSMQDKFLRDKCSQSDVAERATEALGFRVTISNIRGLMGESRTGGEERPIPFKWPSNGGGNRVGGTSLVLARALQDLADSLGYDLLLNDPEMRAKFDAILESSS